MEEIKIKFASFIIDAEKAEKGNNAAGVRARKQSIDLAKMLAAFRKESLTWGK